jgi:hypothetical protein
LGKYQFHFDQLRPTFELLGAVLHPPPHTPIATLFFNGNRQLLGRSLGTKWTYDSARRQCHDSYNHIETSIKIIHATNTTRSRQLHHIKPGFITMKQATKQLQINEWQATWDTPLIWWASSIVFDIFHLARKWLWSKWRGKYRRSNQRRCCWVFSQRARQARRQPKLTSSNKYYYEERLLCELVHVMSIVWIEDIKTKDIKRRYRNIYLRRRYIYIYLEDIYIYILEDIYLILSYIYILEDIYIYIFFLQKILKQSLFWLKTFLPGKFACSTTCRRIEMFALYKSGENLWFAVVKSVNTTSLTPVGLLIIHFFSTRSRILCERPSSTRRVGVDRACSVNQRPVNTLAILLRFLARFSSSDRWERVDELWMFWVHVPSSEHL